MSLDLAIDLGSCNTRIYAYGKGVVLDEPSVVAVDLDTENVIACGKEAYGMLGRTSERIKPIFPISRGVITDLSLASVMLKAFVKKSVGGRLSMQRAVINMPHGFTDVERHNLVSCVMSAGIRKVYLLETCKAAAMGAGADICSPIGRLTLDIGGSITNIGVTSLGDNAVNRYVKLAGNDLDDEIIKYVRKKYNIIIGKRMAEDAKIAVCCAKEDPELKYFKVKGRNCLSGLPRAVEISNFELLPIVESFCVSLVTAIQDVIDETPPELLGDIYTDGIIMTGGTSLLSKLGEYISEKLKIGVCSYENESTCVIEGCGKGIKFIEKSSGSRAGAVNPVKSL